LGKKPFTTDYIVVRPDGFVIFNGAQIVKIEAKQVEDNWSVIFWLLDGTQHVVNASEWTRRFVTETFPVKGSIIDE